MENSIEYIWKQGFLKGDALVAPKVNDLYNQKSQNLLDRFVRKFRINLVAILIGASLLMLAGLLLGAPYVGVFLLAQFAWLVWTGRQELRTLESLDKGASSYEYLTAFRDWLHANMARYRRIYRYFYPVFFIAFGIGMWQVMDNLGAVESLLERFDLWMWQGIPLLALLPLLLLSTLFSVFSGYIYQEDIKAIYGSELRKLEEMLADMEELREG